MGEINDEHVEWAIVSRLRAMLEEPPKTPYNVTQTFALFSSVLLWTKNRVWVAGNYGVRAQLSDQTDHLAHSVREALQDTQITDDPWNLSLVAPKCGLAGSISISSIKERGINSQFERMTAELFFKWLRNALAHGDGRTIRPIHKQSMRAGKTLLAGFCIEFEEERGAEQVLRLSLFRDDMRRIGSVLADLFCKSLSCNEDYFDLDQATKIEEHTL